MKKIILLILMIAVGNTFYSCDEFLDVDNPNSTLDNADPQNLLFAAYAELQDEDVLGIGFESLRTDVGRVGAGVNFNNNNDFAYGRFYLQDIENPGIDERLEGKWNANYKGILQANVTIERLEQIEADNGSLNTVEAYQLAQARCLRGMYHFFLHSVFNQGRVIIRDKPTSVDTSFETVSESDEVIAFFRDDLEYAFNNLFEAADTANGFVSKGFAAALLGKSYLYEGDYEKAIEWLTNPSLTDQYSLLTGRRVLDMFSPAFEFHSESIFELAYNENDLTNETTLGNTTNNVTRETVPQFGNNVRTRTPASGEAFRFRNVTGGGGVLTYLMPPHWLTLAYTSEAMDPSDNRNTVDGSPRPVSLRTSAMVAVPQDTITEYYERDHAAKAVAFGAGYASYYKKYTNHEITDRETQGNNNRELRSGKNIIVMRYAEVKLMLAEAYIELNRLPEAVAEINAIRDRWGLLLLADIGIDVNDQDALRNHLRFVEKPLELSAEGPSVRAIDLRRWGVGTARYEDLQSRRYDFVRLDFSIEDGEVVPTQIDNVLVEDPAGVHIDYDGVVFYTNNGGYLPLPVQERLLNPNVDN